MRELNAADPGYLVDEGGVPTEANREGFLRLLHDAKARRTRRIYVPWGHYAVDLLAADKPTAAQLNPNQPGGAEPGDSAIARLLVESDLEIIGDGAGLSVLSFGCADPILSFGGLKVTQPYSLTTREVTIRSRRPMLADRPTNGLDTFTFGIYVPPRVGNPTGQHQVQIIDSEITGFGVGVYVTSGPEDAVNYLDLNLIGGSIDGQVHAVTCWADPTVGAAKSVYTERTRFSSTDKANALLSSHLLYVHPHCNFRAVRARFYNWRAKKYALAHWGNSAQGAPDFAEFDGCYFDASGEGYAIVTSDRGPTTISRTIINSTNAIQTRHHLIMSDVFVTPNPGPNTGDRLNVFTTFDGQPKITASNVQVDVSYVGEADTGIFDTQTSSAECNLDGIRVFSRRRHNRVAVFVSAPTGNPRVRAHNVEADFYQVTNAEYAAGIRSNGMLSNVKTGSLEIEGSVRGDTGNDGCIRADLAAGLVKMVLDVDASGVTRGVLLNTDATSAGKVSGELRTGGRPLKIIGGPQLLRFPTGEDPAVRTAAVTLVISADFNTVRVVTPPMPTNPDDPGAPAPLMVITNILVNGQVDDTLAYCGSPLTLLGDLGWELGPGGNIDAEPGARALANLRLDLVTRKWTSA